MPDYYLNPAAPPYAQEVALGRVDNVSLRGKFGRNPDIDIGTPEDVWAGGGLYTGFVDAIESVEVFSDSADDAAAGTGARTLVMSGLDENWEVQSEEITLNGTTPVMSALSWWRINSAHVLTGGSGGQNAGAITCRQQTTTANVFFSMPLGENSTTILAYTVPAGKIAITQFARVSLGRANGSNGSAQMVIKERPFGGVFLSKRIETITTGLDYEYNGPGPMNFAAKTDVVFHVASVSDNSSQVSGVLSMYLLDD